MCQKVGDIQESTYRRWNMRDEFNGTVWSRMIVKKFFLYFETIWQERNRMFNANQTSGRVHYLREKIRKILEEKLRVPRALRAIYEN